MADHPGWLLALVTAVERYEEERSKIPPGTECLATALLDVPAPVRDMARGYAQARADAAVVPEESTRASRSCSAFHWATADEPGGPCVITGEHRDHRDEYGHEWSATR